MVGDMTFLLSSIQNILTKGLFVIPYGTPFYILKLTILANG